jgi:hypothetical protein
MTDLLGANTKAATIELSTAEVATLNELPPAFGNPR